MKTKFRSAIPFLLIFLFLLPSLYSCHEDSCEDAVTAFLNAAKDYDHETLSSFAKTDADEVFFWGLNDVQFSAYTDSITHSPSFRLFYRFCAKKLSYQIKESVVNGDKAFVTVECKYVNGSDAILTLYNDTLSTMALHQMDGTLDLSFDYYDQSIVARISADDEEYLSATLVLECHRGEDGWKILCTPQVTEVITSCLFPEKNDSETK